MGEGPFKAMDEGPKMNVPHNARLQEVEADPYVLDAEFDMGSDDGSSSSSDSSVPAKYTFYHPLPRTAQSGFVLRLDTHHSQDSTPPNDPKPRFSEPFGIDDPPPLSPIEELDDDLLHQPVPKPKSGQAASIASVKQEVDDGLSLERRSELLFSRQHLELILADPKLSSRFTSFLRTYRPDSVPILVYLLDTVKALKAIRYAEAIISGLEPVPGYDFTVDMKGATISWVIEDKADRALEVLVKDDLPAFIAYVYVRTVDIALVNRVTRGEDQDTLHIQNGLAEVFVLSDPSQTDNPVVFASEEFHEMTQYPRTYALGRNCRFLGGPKTDVLGITRFRASLDAEREHCEVLLNYRRDGTPFINLIMCVPLRDQYNKVRYFLGAQLDITGLVNDCTELESLRRLVDQQSKQPRKGSNGPLPSDAVPNDAFEQLGETFNSRELEVLLKLRRRLNPDIDRDEGSGENIVLNHTPAVTSEISTTNLNSIFQLNGQGSAPPLGFYQNYLLVRPFPSLRILFASPDLRVAGILQAPLMSQIGGSQRVREDLEHALEVGRKVTAKVQWISKPAQTTRPRWIHCTPLLGINGLIAVWMVILVDDVEEEEKSQAQVPVVPTASNEAARSTSEALPWEAAGKPGLSGALGNGFVEGSTSSNSSLSGAGSRNPYDLTPPVPERNRLRKGRPSNIRLPSEPSEDAMLGATVSPFAAPSDTRYKVKVWSGGVDDEPKQSMEDESRPRATRPRFGQPPVDVGGSGYPPFAVRPGPRINGRAYSLNSNSEHGISADGERASGSIDDDRPMSQSNSIPSPSRSNGQPLGPPVNVPRMPDATIEADSRRPGRRTYKSLSPYGILFND